MSDGNIHKINLESLIDLSAKLIEKQSEEEILSAAILSLMGKLKIFRATALIVDGETAKPVISKGKKTSLRYESLDVPAFLDLETNQNELYADGFKYALPVKHIDDVLYIIALGPKAGSGDLSMEEIQYASLVAYIAANAIVNARNVNSIISSSKNLERRNQLLSAMFEMSKDFAENISEKNVLKLFTYRLLGQLVITKFSLYYIEHNGEYSALINRFKHNFHEKSLERASKFTSAQIIGENSELSDLKEFGVSIVAPLIVQGKPKGLILIGEKLSKEEFTDDNLLFIEALGNTAIAALENARLFEDQLEKEKLESELNLALEIQKGLLPKSSPIIDGYSLSGVSYPSKQIGGDYFDYIDMQDGTTMLAIADVSGKGVPAALHMANVQAALRALAPLNLSLTELAQRINAILYQNTAADKFVTFFCGILEPISGVFTYLNAGHNPPFLARANGSIDELTEGGLILGLLEEPPKYDEGKVVINRGDALLLYTDGATESMNLAHEEFGEESLKAVLLNTRENCALTILEASVSAVRLHAKGAPQFDDLTLCVLKRAS